MKYLDYSDNQSLKQLGPLSLSLCAVVLNGSKNTFLESSEH